jgi:hypothetical protein
MKPPALDEIQSIQENPQQQEQSMITVGANNDNSSGDDPHTALTKWFVFYFLRVIIA